MSAPAQTEKVIVVKSLQAFMEAERESEEVLVARYRREAGAGRAMLEEARRLSPACK